VPPCDPPRHQARDLIEYPIVDLMDYSGWDLRESLFLLNKSNPVLFEWLQSPLVYREHARYRMIMRAAVLHDPILNRIIGELLELKRGSGEMGEAPQIPEVNAFIESKLEHFRQYASSRDPRKKPEANALNRTFREILRLQ
jgi:predicted nucleotidyltransferase